MASPQRSTLLFFFVAVVAVLLLGSAPARSDDVGDLLYRTFLLFKNQPLNASAAISQGWEAYTDCDENYGIAYAYEQEAPSQSNSPILYFTSAGQIAGIGERVWGNPPASLIPAFWRPVEDLENAYDITVSFRNSSLMCTDAYDNEHILGDQLTINGNFDIPLTMTSAEQAGWLMGNCIDKMGIHHSYDLNAPGSSTWNVSSLVPVMPMYHPDTDEITAVLFLMPDLQYVEPLGDWEGPFIPSVFCKNWCSNSGCEFYDVDVFTTMHWMFKDPDLNTCTDAPCSL
eukprot:TRINITY_DN12433_c0_g1_i2.p1 TRINITY_DN12433_c0_g1~~TRINITY_DN12433_c0_g1_i2.p1  ORF type:complete len:298 (-),score=61.26 TRINITY_DN12433_c0_g1_i2:141-995(-)